MIDDGLVQQDIVACTEGEPQARLKSAAELVQRLAGLPERRLAQQAEHAMALQTAQALAEGRRQRARRPWVAASVVCLAVGLTVSVWFYRQAVVSLHESELQAMRTQAINDFLNRDVLASPELGRSRSGQAATMVDILQRASSNAEQRFKGQPTLEASVRLQLADTHMRMYNVFAAHAEYERAFNALRTLRPANDPQRLVAQLGLSSALSRLSRQREARQLLDDAAPAAAALGHRLPEVAYAMAKAEYDALLAENRFKDALVPATTLQRLVDGGGRFDLGDRLDARLRLAELHYQLGDQTAAAALVATLSASPFQAAGAGPVLQARVLVQQARQDTNGGNRVAAESKLRKARQLLLDSVGGRDYYVGIVNAELAELYVGLDKPALATAALADALVALKASLGEEHEHVRLTVVNLALVELGQGRAREALLALDAQRPWFAQGQGQRARHVVQAIDFRRAIALNSLGRSAEALPVLAGIDSGQLAQASWGKDWPWKLQAERGRALVGVGQKAEGVRLLSEAVQALRESCYTAPDCAVYERALADAQRR